MKAVKYFSKPIIIVLHLAILTLLAIAIIIPFAKDLFVSNEIAKSSYQIATTQPLSYTFKGLFEFSNTLLENSNNNGPIFSFIKFSEEAISALKNIKVILICLFVVIGILTCSQVSKYRVYATNICSALILTLMLILRNHCLNNFADSKLIIEANSVYQPIITLLIIALCISFVQIAFKEFINRFNVQK